MRPKSVLGYRTKSSLDRIKANNPKIQRVGTSGHKNGVQGLAPGVLSSDFLQRKSGSPAGVGGEPTSQVLTCDGPNGTTYRRRRPQGRSKGQSLRAPSPRQ